MQLHCQKVSAALQARNGSLFPAAVVTLYCTYLCYSSLQSEPHDYQCNGLGKRLTAASGSTLAIGMVITIVSVVYSALRAGSNTQTFSRGVQGASEQPLVGVDEEEGLTSAGLDGEPEDQRMSEPGWLTRFQRADGGLWGDCKGSHEGLSACLLGPVIQQPAGVLVRRASVSQAFPGGLDEGRRGSCLQVWFESLGLRT